MAKRNGDGADFGDGENQILDTAERLPADLMVLKMENEQIFALARTRGRDYEKIKKDLVAGLEAFPEAAVDSIYAKPVGFKKDTCSKCGADIARARGDEPPKSCPNPRCNGAKVIIGGQQYARNLSIRAAETLASAFGFCRTSTMLSDYGDEKVKITATFTDYTSCRVHIADSICSPYYKARGGTMAKMPDDRFLELKVKAESSKAIREATLRCIPHPLRIWYMTECEKVASRLLTKDKVAEILNAFDNFGVSEVDLGLLLGKPLKLGLTEEDRKVLLGLYTQIKESPEDFWPALNRLREEVLPSEPVGDHPPGTKEAAAAKSSQPLSAKDLMGGKKKTEPAPTVEETAAGEVIPVVSRSEIAKATTAPKAPESTEKAPTKTESFVPGMESGKSTQAEAKPAGPSSLQSIVNYAIQLGYEAADFDMPKIFASLRGIKDWPRVTEAILTGRHPDTETYRTNPLEAPQSTGEVSQESPPEQKELVNEDDFEKAERLCAEKIQQIKGYKQAGRIQSALAWSNENPLFSDVQKKSIHEAAMTRVREIEAGNK